MFRVRHTLFFLFFFSRGGSSTGITPGSSSTGSRSGGSGTTTRANVEKQVLHILAFQGLCKEGGPDRFDVRDTGGLDEVVQFIGLWSESTISVQASKLVFNRSSTIAGGLSYSDLDAIVGKDESRVSAGKFGVRHFGDWSEGRIVWILRT